MGDIFLRPLCQADLDLYCRWQADPTVFGPYDAPAGGSLQDLRMRYSKTGLLSEKAGCLLVIARPAQPVGFVQYCRHCADAWVMWGSVFIAIPDMRGRGLGTAAHRSLCAYVFTRFPAIHKLECWTDRENLAEQRALAKAGFVHEGTLRARNRLRGAFRDMAVYGFIRTQWREPAP